MADEVFIYRARDPLGKMIEGTIEAPGEEEAWQQLTRDGFRVVELMAEEDDGLALFEIVTRSEIIYLTNQLAVMVDTGIALASALKAVSEQEKNPALRRLLIEISQDVEAGGEFSQALAKHPKYFDDTYVALVRASEATGTLGPMLERIAAYLRAALDSRAKVRSAMIYPAVMLVFAIGVTVFLLTYVMPKFTPIFRARKIEVPGLTKFMMNVSSTAIDYWYVWLGLVMAMGVAWFVAQRSTIGRRLIDGVKLNLPLLGPVFRKMAICRSLRTLGTMLDSGVPVLEALELCAAVSGNVHYRELWLRVRDEITTGQRICDALRGSPLIPHVLVQMVASGEETGKLGSVLLRVAEFYDRDVEHSVKTVTSLLEPAMIVVMGAVVGAIGLSLMLPIFRLSRQT